MNFVFYSSTIFAFCNLRFLETLIFGLTLARFTFLYYLCNRFDLIWVRLNDN